MSGQTPTPTMAPPPFTTPVLAATSMFSAPWQAWISNIWQRLTGAPYQVRTLSLTKQAANIAFTYLPTSTLSGGRYLLSFYSRVTQAATVSSSLTVAVTWVDGGITCVNPFFASTGNTTDTFQSLVLHVRCDEGSNIGYSVAYGSVGATPMQYSLDLALQQLPT